MPPLFGKRARSVSVARRRSLPRLMTMGQLPDELLLHLLEFIQPRDLANFAQACRHIHDCSRKYLEKHRKLRARYSEVVLRWQQPEADDPFYHFQHPIFLLEKIYNEPAIAHYIELFEFVGVDIVTKQKRKDQTIHDQIQKSLSDCHDARDALLAHQPLYGDLDSLKTRLELLSAGSRSEGFLLLLQCLPYLERLRINDFFYWEHNELKGFHQILASLPSLHTVEVYSGSDGGHVDMMDLISFAFTPNIRTIRGYQVRGPEAGKLSRRIPTSAAGDELCSNVESIEITQGSMALLGDLRDRFIYLHTFRYSFHPDYLDPSQYLHHVFDIVQDLYAGFRKQLRSLSLVEVDFGTGEVPSFTGFEVLRELEIDTVSLYCTRLHDGCFEPSMAAPPRLVDILPPSLETLLLNFDDEFDVTRQLFDGFADNKEQYLPNLHTITLVEIEDDEFAILEPNFIAAGVQIIREFQPYIPKHARYWSKQIERDEEYESRVESDNDEDDEDWDDDDDDDEDDDEDDFDASNGADQAQRQMIRQVH